MNDDDDELIRYLDWLSSSFLRIVESIWKVEFLKHNDDNNDDDDNVDDDDISLYNVEEGWNIMKSRYIIMNIIIYRKTT